MRVFRNPVIFCLVNMRHSTCGSVAGSATPSKMLDYMKPPT